MVFKRIFCILLIALMFAGGNAFAQSRFEDYYGNRLGSPSSLPVNNGYGIPASQQQSSYPAYPQQQYGYPQQYPQQQYPQQQYGGQPQQYFAPSPQNQFISAPDPMLPQKVMTATEYITNNPSQTPYFLQTILGINVSKINVAELTQLAQTRNTPMIIREVTWLAQNRDAINNGTFNDVRYSLNSMKREEDYDIDETQSKGFLGISSDGWLLGGLGLASIGGAAFIIGSSGASTVSTGGSYVAEPDAPFSLAVCEPTLNNVPNPIYDNGICYQCTNSYISDGVCDISITEAANLLTETNSLSLTDSTIQLLEAKYPNKSRGDIEFAVAQCEGQGPTCITCALDPGSDFCTVSQTNFCTTNYNAYFCSICTAYPNRWYCAGTNSSSSSSSGSSSGSSSSGGSSSSSSSSSGSGAVGSSCTSTSQCASGLWCFIPSGSSNGICMNDPQVGDYCQNNNMCFGSQGLVCDIANQECIVPGSSSSSSSGGGSGSSGSTSSSSGGGSSGGSSSGAGSPGWGRSPIADNPNTPPSSFQTAEFNSFELDALNAHKAQYAYAKGITGAGIKIGIHDAFVPETYNGPPWPTMAGDTLPKATADAEISGKIALNQNSNNDGAGNCATPCPHGNRVSRWAAGAKNGVGYHGVAYDAQIMITSYGYSLRNLVDAGADVINMSYGTSQNMLSDLNYAADHDVVLVASAGNANQPVSGYPAGAAPNLTHKTMIISIALNGNDTKASYSSYCTTNTMNYCLSARSNSGTSFSAPFTAGAAALVKSGWNWLSAEQIVDILFKTADDLGTPGVDPTYGWGKLNIQAAVSPAGTSSIMNAQGLMVPYTSSLNNITNMQNSPLGDSLNGSNNNINFTFVDSYGRDFGDRAADHIKNPDANVSMEEVVNRVGEVDISDKAMTETKLNDNFSLRYNALTLNEESIAAGETQFFTDYKFNLGNDGKKGRFSFGFTNEVKKLYKNDSDFNLNNFVSDVDFSIPYLEFAKDTNAVATELGMDFSDKFSSRISGLYSVGKNNDELISTYDNSIGFASSILEFEYRPTEELKLNFKNGMMMEYDTLFGTRSEGLLDLTDNTQTLFSGLDMNYDLSEKWSIFASGYIGSTSIKTSPSSTFTDATDIITDSYTLALTRKEIFGNDSLTLSLAQPLRVIDGSIDGITLRVNPQTGEQSYAGFAQSLVPSGRTLRAQLAYEKEYDEDTDVFVTGSVEDQPLHTRDSENIFTILGKIKHKLN